MRGAIRYLDLWCFYMVTRSYIVRAGFPWVLVLFHEFKMCHDRVEHSSMRFEWERQ